MLTFDDIHGQATAVGVLRGLLESGHVPHALLLHGPENVGKATTARVFASALICETSGDSACGTCGSCLMVERGNHPDLLLVSRITKKEWDREKAKAKKEPPLASADPDPPEENLVSQILIDQVRRVISLATLKPRQSPRRIFLIDPADRLNPPSQNALLKTLEEPPDSSILILITARPHALLPTVRSRCFGVGFPAMRTAELATVLRERGLAADDAGARAALAGGRLGNALELDLAERRRRREDVLNMLCALSGGLNALDGLPAMVSAFAGKDEPTLLDGLDLAEGLLRDAARTGAGGPETDLLHADLLEDVAKLGRTLGPERAAVLVASIERARGYLRYNTNRVLIAQTLLAAVAGGPLP